MRLIDIDPITEKLKNAVYLGKRIGADTADLEAILADIEKAFTVKIIYCKECVYYDEESKLCFLGGVWAPDDYCSYGRRTGGER